MARTPTANVQAYDCYLRGRQYLRQYRRRSLEFALQMFARAIEIDPDYALAHAGQADCHSLLYAMWDRSPGRLQQADSASRRAMELAPDLAEAHVARGFALYLGQHYDEARREFETAVHHNPQLYEAYFYHGKVCQMQGKLVEAAALFAQAAQVDPDDYQALLKLGTTYLGLGRTAESEAVSRQGLERAEKHLALHPDDSRTLALGASSWCIIGEPERALDWASRALAMDPKEPLTLYNVACVYALLKRVNDALDALERAVVNGYSDREWMRHDPDLAALRGQPRFEELIKNN